MVAESLILTGLALLAFAGTKPKRTTPIPDPDPTLARCSDRVKALDKLGREHSGVYELPWTSSDS